MRRQVTTALAAQDWSAANDGLQVLAALAPHDAWVRQWQVVVAMALHRPPSAVEAALAALQLLPPEAATQRSDVAYTWAKPMLCWVSPCRRSKSSCSPSVSSLLLH